MEKIYLDGTIPIGVINKNRVMDMPFSSIEFEPELSEMLSRLEVTPTNSITALRTALKLLQYTTSPDSK